MSTLNAIDQAEAAKANIPAIDFAPKKSTSSEKHEVDESVIKEEEREPLGPNGEIYPTESERATLRHVTGKVPWTAYTIGFVELCERFSYYGTTAVCK
jgi:proton-dependent oligopeptide transporter, POT family